MFFHLDAARTDSGFCFIFNMIASVKVEVVAACDVNWARLCSKVVGEAISINWCMKV